MKGGSRDVQGVLRTARGPVYEGTPGKGGSRDAQGIFRTSCGPVYEGTPREDPGMSKGSSGQQGGLCMRGHHYSSVYKCKIFWVPKGGFEGVNLHLIFSSRPEAFRT